MNTDETEILRGSIKSIGLLYKEIKILRIAVILLGLTSIVYGLALFNILTFIAK
jgi:hypothetical protein